MDLRIDDWWPRLRYAAQGGDLVGTGFTSPSSVGGQQGKNIGRKIGRNIGRKEGREDGR